MSAARSRAPWAILALFVAVVAGALTLPAPHAFAQASCSDYLNLARNPNTPLATLETLARQARSDGCAAQVIQAIDAKLAERRTPLERPSEQPVPAPPSTTTAVTPITVTATTRDSTTTTPATTTQPSTPPASTTTAPAQSAAAAPGSSPLTVTGLLIAGGGALVALLLVGILFTRRTTTSASSQRYWPIMTVALALAFVALFLTTAFASGLRLPSPVVNALPQILTTVVVLFAMSSAAMIGRGLHGGAFVILIFGLTGAIAALYQIAFSGGYIAQNPGVADSVSVIVQIGALLGVLGLGALALLRARGNWLVPLACLITAAAFTGIRFGFLDTLFNWTALALALVLVGTAFKRIFWPPAEAPAEAPYAVRRLIRSLAGARLPLAIAAAGAVAALALQTHREGAVRALSPHGAPITAMAFSQDGAWLAVASEDGEIRVWPTRGGRSHRIVNPDGPARQLLFDTLTVDEDGAQVVHQRLLFTTAMGRVRGVDAQTSAPLLADDAVPVSVSVPYMAATAEGVRIVASGANSDASVVSIRGSEVTRHADIPSLPANDRIVSVQALPQTNTTLVITAMGRFVSFRDGESRSFGDASAVPTDIRAYPLEGFGLVVAAGEIRGEAGRWEESQPFAVCPGKVLTDRLMMPGPPPQSLPRSLLFVTDAGQLCHVRLVEGQEPSFNLTALAEAPTAAMFTHDDQIILGFADGSVRLADMAGEFHGRIGGHGDRVTTIALSSDGRHVATAAADGSVLLFDRGPSAAPVYAVPNAMAETADREGRRHWAAMIDRIAPPPVQSAAAEHPGFALLREAGLAGPYSDESIGCQFTTEATEVQTAGVRRALEAFNASLLREGDPAQTAAANLGAGCALLALGGDENVAEAIRHFELAAAIAPRATEAQSEAAAVMDAAAQPPPTAAATQAPNPEAAEARSFAAATQLNTVAGYEEYLRRFPNGRNRAAAEQALARARIFEMGRRAQEQQPARGLPRQEATTTTQTSPTPSTTPADRPNSEADRAAWTTASRRDTIEGYSAYLANFPEGQFARRAGTRIAELRAAERPPPPEPRE